MSEDLALHLHGVNKRYGAHVALSGLELKVPRGSIFGLVGPNGAGKTTTFSIICGFLRADSGTVDLLGNGPFDPVVHRGRLLALPQDAALGRDMPVHEQLEFFAMLQGLPAAEAQLEVARVLGVVDLEDRANDRVRTLSHGMNRRMGIAQAFLGKPELILLDEPTNGLDPRQAQQIRETVAQQRGERTLIVSSHNLHEIEALCDHVAIIDHGQVKWSGAMGEITGKDAEVSIALSPGPVPLAALQAALLDVAVHWEEGARVLHLRFQEREDRCAEDIIGQALAVLLAAQARIAGVSRGRSLERVYLENT